MLFCGKQLMERLKRATITDRNKPEEILIFTLIETHVLLVSVLNV